MQNRTEIKKTDNKNMILPTVIAAALALAIFLLVACLLFADLFLVREELTEIYVPSYVGHNELSAAFDGNIEIERVYAYSDSAEEGIVLSQSFSGKTKIESGEKFRLKITVSLGEEKNTLPQLRGLDIYKASAILREMGCVVKTVFSESDETADSVLFTVPEADTALHSGEVVTLYVATRSAPVTVRVPDFYGYNAESLQERVKMHGLTLGKIEFIYSEDFPANCVIYQSIGEGCLVRQGEAIDFYVSKATEN